MHLLDSSVWIALFVEADAHHMRALQIFKGITGTIYVPYIVIEETASMLAYKHSKQHADTFVSFIARHPRCTIADSNARIDIEMFLQTSLRISFADISIIALSLLTRSELVTFDAEMQKEFHRRKGAL